MAHGRFGTAINCIDGRVQLPVIEWMKASYHLDHVDMITEPGPDRVLAAANAMEVSLIKSKVLISVKKHGSDVIVIAGHGDCAGNPVTEEEHWAQLRRAIQVVRSWNLPISKVTGVWIGDDWNVEVIDTSE